MRRHWLELAWVALGAASFAAMIIWPHWRLIPFELVWVGLTVLYGFRLWRMRWTLVVLAGVMVATAFAVGFDSMHDIGIWTKLYPLMAVLFLAMVWHARRHVDAQRLAERHVEQTRSLLERQERFIHDASHELRTPVTIARGHLELLRGHGTDAAELDVALDELGRIDAIIERLLVLATAGQPDFVQTAEIELEPLLEDVFMRWSEVAPRAWQLGPLVAGRLLVDVERLRAALDALLENAVKYTERYAAIELRTRHDGPGQVVIEVQDEGCGIPPEALGRIFDRFTRADPARSRSAGGVGLGLAIVDAIAKGHGGSCTVTSSGQGSIFALRLPNFTPTAVGVADRSLVGR